MPSFQTHYVGFGCLPQQASECDDRGHAGTVQEQDGGETLQTEGIPNVTPVEWQLPLGIQDQTSKYPARGGREHLMNFLLVVHDYVTALWRRQKHLL